MVNIYCVYWVNSNAIYSDTHRIASKFYYSNPGYLQTNVVFSLKVLTSGNLTKPLDLTWYLFRIITVNQGMGY
jgi:hypothetical protein